MNEHLQFDEQCTLYVVGALDAAEQEAFESHLAGCPSCNAELLMQQRIVHLLPYSLPPQQPPLELKQQLLARLAFDQGAATSVRRPAPPPLSWLNFGWTAALLLVLLGSALMLDRSRSDLQQREDSILVLQRQLAQQEQAMGRLRAKEQQLASLQRDLARDRNALQLLTSPQLTTFQLAGLKDAPQASARVYWNRERNIWVFLVRGLPPLPAGKTYQLWFINKRSQKISAGTFTPLSSGADRKSVV